MKAKEIAKTIFSFLGKIITLGLSAYIQKKMKEKADNKLY